MKKKQQLYGPVNYRDFRETDPGPLQGKGQGELEPPPEIVRLELNSATKVEFFY